MSDTMGLCYVTKRDDGDFAYFTSQPLAAQWGDDWNDAPYEYNAGPPYTFGDHDKAEGKQRWRIEVLHFDGGNFNTPADLGYSCCVQDINEGGVAWLKGCGINIFAGTTPDDFRRLIKAGGGTVHGLI